MSTDNKTLFKLGVIVVITSIFGSLASDLLSSNRDDAVLRTQLEGIENNVSKLATKSDLETVRVLIEGNKDDIEDLEELIPELLKHFSER